MNTKYLRVEVLGLHCQRICVCRVCFLYRGYLCGVLARSAPYHTAMAYSQIINAVVRACSFYQRALTRPRVRNKAIINFEVHRSWHFLFYAITVNIRCMIYYLFHY